MRDYDRRLLKKISNGKVRKLYRCHECFTPRLLQLLFKWNGGGGTTLRLVNRNLRFAFVENDLLNRVLEMLASHFGEEEVYKIARNVERASSSGYVAMLFAAEQWWLKPVSFLAKYSYLMDYILETNVTFLGYGACNVADKKLPNAALYARHPYNRTLFQADLEGVYLVIRDREVDAVCDPISKDEEIYLYLADVSMPRSPGIYKQFRVHPEPLVPVKDPFEYHRCPKCGVPKQIGQFWWDPRDGVIVNKDTGKRVILWPCYALEQLLGTLREQLGEEAEVLITNTVKRYQRDNILDGGVGFTPEEKLEFVETDKKGQYALLLRHLSCMGYGHGELSMEESNKVKISMTNALMPVVTSGLMAGMVEALEGEPVKVSWEEKAETTTYTLKW